ncbi:DNA polymerase III subunit alpha [Chrysoperla carnea]|uniref:DNA polymerase III subunit alpha n=1 Tax=Chrysoperla carnea TaxID=189513 RepID=UPI001D06DE43|nr:DNA polymerase III subunit alpha [Chrysoperla carnea]
MPAICLTDKENLFGSLEFALYAIKKGLQPIHGVILNIQYEANVFAEILLIAKDETGYKNLLKLSSITFTTNDRKICNHITFEDLKEYQEGLIALCCYTEGIIGKCLLANKEEQAEMFARNLQEIFGDCFYFEIMRHDLPEEQHIEDNYIKIASKLNIPLVATNKVLFSKKSMHDAHDVLLCISAGVTKEYPDHRISIPDFDIDFCQERREEVINYVRSKYGNNRVGQIITFGKMQAKAVIKDVARVLSLPYKFADYLTELVPFSAINPVTLEQAIREVPELANAAKGNGLYNLEGELELIKLVLDTSLILEGLHRHSSTHAAGIVIAGTDLVDIVPIYKDANSDILVVGYSMKYCELAGLIKFDFLGLQTLTVITDCKKLLKEQNIEIDFNDMTFDDEKTYQMLCKGKGVGVFEFESVGMKDALRRLKPDSIHDLTALGALYRPGPMENIPTYIACKHKLQQPDYLHKLLKPILEETYGVVIYQEQVQRIAQVLAGYTLGAADLLRRAMGKKIKSEMEQQEEIFVKGAIANNISKAQAKSIFATVAKFAGYGFNKAHPAAYGVISYQTAYLKANYPAEFVVACLNLELNNRDKINLFLQEAKDNNIKIIAPNINISDGYFSVKSVIPRLDLGIHGDQLKDTAVKPRYDIDSSIIFALGAIKGVTPNFGKLVTDERNARGAFKSIVDFIERLPPKAINSKLLENLIKAGCFDELHDNRLQLF